MYSDRGGPHTYSIPIPMLVGCGKYYAPKMSLGGVQIMFLAAEYIYLCFPKAPADIVKLSPAAIEGDTIEVDCIHPCMGGVFLL